jgi:type IV pilus assembly protein PilF
VKNIVLKTLLVLCIPLLIVGCASAATKKKNQEVARKQVVITPAAKRKAKKEDELRLLNTHVELAVSYLQRNQLEYALENINKALDIDSRHSQANNVMALLQWRLNDKKSAENYFERAVNADSNNSQAINNYGVLLCENDKLDKAIEMFKTALKNPLYKTPDTAHTNIGVCQLKKPDAYEAEKHFRLALNKNPRFPPALFQLAKLKLSTGDPMAGRAFMERYLNLAGDSPDALLLAISIERTLNNKDAEASYALRLRSKFPDSPEAKLIQGRYGPVTP